MHLIYWKTETLLPLLSRFVGGQFRLAKLSATEDTKYMMMFHGETKSIEIPDLKIKRVVIFFEWLCERRCDFGRSDKLQSSWSLLPVPPSGKLRLDIDYVTFYPQPTKNRLKLKGWGKEALLSRLNG